MNRSATLSPGALLDGTVLRQARAGRRWWWRVAAASLTVNLLLLTPTLYMLQLYERVLYSMNHLTLAMVSLLAAVLLLAMGWADRWRGIWLDRAAASLQQRLQGALFQSGWRAAHRGAAVEGSDRLRDLAVLRQYLAGPGATAALDLPWTPVYLGLTWVLHPMLGVALLCFLLLQVLLAWKGHSLSVPAAVAVQVSATEEARHARRQFQQADTVAPLGMSSGLRARWLQRHMVALNVSQRSQALSNRLAAASKSLRYLQQSAALGLGAWLVVRGEISAGAMIAGTVLTTRALAPVDALVSQWKELLAAIHAALRIESALAPGAVQPQQMIEYVAQPHEGLVLDDVSAWVPGQDRCVLLDISLTFPAGQIVAVTGPSGAGKSTLARLLVGAWPSAFGSIWRPIGGSRTGYLPQEAVLLPGTVAENIARMGIPDPQTVLAAAQRADVHDLVLRLPKGYDTPIGEGGYRLSGGMSQRLALARAIYGDPSLVVLDEPAAHLDEAGELALATLLQSLRQAGCTVIVITHTRSLLRLVDRTLILDSGQIVGDDSPA